jgi:hypothetical protein
MDVMTSAARPSRCSLAKLLAEDSLDRRPDEIVFRRCRPLGPRTFPACAVQVPSAVLDAGRAATGVAGSGLAPAGATAIPRCADGPGGTRASACPSTRWRTAGGGLDSSGTISVVATAGAAPLDAGCLFGSHSRADCLGWKLVIADQQHIASSNSRKAGRRVCSAAFRPPGPVSSTMARLAHGPVTLATMPSRGVRHTRRPITRGRITCGPFTCGHITCGGRSCGDRPVPRPRIPTKMPARLLNTAVLLDMSGIADFTPRDVYRPLPQRLR